MDSNTLLAQADKRKSRPHPQLVAQQLGLYASTNAIITNVWVGDALVPSAAPTAREPGVCVYVCECVRVSVCECVFVCVSACECV
jgi:hypothetical protein